MGFMELETEANAKRLQSLLAANLVEFESREAGTNNPSAMQLEVIFLGNRDD